MTDKTHTTQDILASQSFALINTLIDEAVKEIATIDVAIVDVCASVCAKNADKDSDSEILRTKIHEEVVNGAPHESALALDHELQVLASMQLRRNASKSQIHRLQVVKLRLLNDYDFTRGDATFQRAILGEPAQTQG